MFIRIVRGDYAGVYECARYFIGPVLNHEDQMEITMEGHEGAINVIAEKRSTDVFVMNSDGRTIDSIRYQRKGKS